MPTVAFNPGKPLTASASDILRELVRDGAVAKTPSANFLNVCTRGAGSETQKLRFVTTPSCPNGGSARRTRAVPRSPL